MKYALIPAIIAALLAACATTPSYGPASTPQAFGYTDYQTDGNKYRVAYLGKDFIEANDGVMRRAAELALENGYDHFTILNRSVFSPEATMPGAVSAASYTPSVVRIDARHGGTVNIYGSDDYRQHANADPFLARSNYRGKGTLARIDVVMGLGIAPRGSSSYQAQRILAANNQ